MLSRVADSLYWLGRYLERTENYARFLDVNFNLCLDLPPGVQEQWKPLIAATGDLISYEKRYEDYERENAIFFLTFDRENNNSIINSVSYARENGRMIRENIAAETWEAINDLYHFMNYAEKKKIWRKENPHEFFIKVKQKVLLIYGIVKTTAFREEGWYFNQVGQHLERADKTSRILDVKYHLLLPTVHDVGSPLDFLHWAALLKSVSGFNSYRRNYGKTDPASVVEYLLLNQFFPRSIYYCIKQAEYYLRSISGNSEGKYNAAEKCIGNLLSHLEFGEIKEVIAIGLHEYLDDLQLKINDISNKIHAHYFEIQPNFAVENTEQ